MKKILLQIIILFLFVSCSQNKKTDFEFGNLWKIESKSGIESFIYGTVHLYPSSEIELSDSVISKLKKCNVLALETEISNKSEQQKFADIKQPKSLLDFIRVIKADYGNELKNMEAELVKISRESKIYLTGLESNDEILKIMKVNSEIKIPEKKLTDEQILDDYQQGLNLYQAESIQKIYEVMTIQSGDKVTKLLVDNRNENWIDNIESLIENDKTFIAVGVGHLGGENGILKLLSEKGYNITRVE
jgi:uncharacterized protein YbaP (TraB family)